MERRLYWGLLGLLMAALGWFGVSSAVSGAHEPLAPVRFDRLVFVAVMMGSIPVTIFVFIPLRLLLRAPGGRMFWIKHPSRTIEHLGREPATEAVARAQERLTALGFTVEPPAVGEAGTLMLFRKAKAKEVVSFVDHAFGGELLVSPGAGGTRVIATVTFEDIVVVESGERERLAALAGYVAGAVTELKVAVLPFTMLCGVIIAIGNLILWPVPGLHPWLAAHELSIALAAVGMILFGSYPILRNRAENYGLPLALLGLAAAFLPMMLG
jgi:hypothetical protein